MADGAEVQQVERLPDAGLSRAAPRQRLRVIVSRLLEPPELVVEQAEVVERLGLADGVAGLPVERERLGAALDGGCGLAGLPVRAGEAGECGHLALRPPCLPAAGQRLPEVLDGLAVAADARMRGAEAQVGRGL